MKRWREKIDRLIERIAANDSSLREVDLSYRGIGTHDFKKLKKVDPNRPGVNDEDATRLAEALVGNTTVTALRMRENIIGVAGAQALAGMLRTNATVAHLDLAENYVGVTGAVALVGALRVNSALVRLNLLNNYIGAAGASVLARDAAEVLQVNHTITTLKFSGNMILGALLEVLELLDINSNAPNSGEAHRVKIERRIGQLLDSEDGADDEAAVSLALGELRSFPEAKRRWGLFNSLLGSHGHGARVAAAVDADTGRALYGYAAECGAAPGVLMNLLRAHPPLCTCRDVRHKLYPFMLLATMLEAGTGDILELLLQNPSLVESGVN